METMKVGGITISGVEKILPKLSAIQKGFSIHKEGESYNYRCIEDVVGEVKKLAHQENCNFFSSSDLVENGTIRATIVLMDNEGNYISSGASVYMDNTLDSRSQNCGSGISYAKKYAIYNLLAVADNEDDIDVKNDKSRNFVNEHTKEVEKAEPSPSNNIEATPEVTNEATATNQENSPEVKKSSSFKAVNSGTSISSKDATAKNISSNSSEALNQVANEEPVEMTEELAGKTICEFNNSYNGMSYEQILKIALGFNKPSGETPSNNERKMAYEFFSWVANDFKGNSLLKEAAKKMLEAYQKMSNMWASA